MTNVLGIKVDSNLVETWREIFAPELQPFRTDKLGAHAEALGRDFKPSLDVRDTFHVYSDDGWTWLEEDEFLDQKLSTRRALLHGRAATGRVRDIPNHLRDLAGHTRTDSRIVWWPSLLRKVGDKPLLEYVVDGLPPSRHRDVSKATGAGAKRLVPRAEELAGTFPARSGPNCFGNVLAGVGAAGEGESTQREPFESWLKAHTVPIRGTARDHQPGVVLVWRNEENLVEHAAITIGDGLVFNKSSQGWFSPRVIWTVPETIAASRYRGAKLSRYLSSGGQ